MIDHTAYPDIVDQVFLYADLGALLSLRAACSSFRDRVGAQLATHLAFRSDRISPASSKGWHPALLCLRPGEATPVDSILPLFARTTSLDIDAEGDFLAYPRIALARGHFTSLREVRVRPHARLEDEEGIDLALDVDSAIVRTPWPPHPSSGFPITEPAVVTSTKRLVYNVDASQPAYPSLLLSLTQTQKPPSTALRDVVIAFLPPSSPIIDARDRALLRTIITAALEAADPGDIESPEDEEHPLRVTLVNTAEVPPDCIPIPSSEFDDYVTVDADGVLGMGFGQTLPTLSFLQWKRDEERNVHPLERYMRATLMPVLGRAEMYRRIRFLSMDEYRDEVGEAAFRNEIEWTERP